MGLTILNPMTIGYTCYYKSPTTWSVCVLKLLHGKLKFLISGFKYYKIILAIKPPVLLCFALYHVRIP